MIEMVVGKLRPFRETPAEVTHLMDEPTIPLA
jgi:hypothetical protein